MHSPIVAARGVVPGSICHHLQVLHGPHESEDDAVDDDDFFTSLFRLS